MSKKEQNPTKMMLIHWAKKLDKSFKMIAMAFEDYVEAHRNVLQFTGLLMKEYEEKIAKLEKEIVELKKIKKVKRHERS